jgi:hypothetical protein
VNEQQSPEAAIVGVTANENLEVLFGTSHKTRKYGNLQANPRVAITVGDFKAEVQYEGDAKQVELDAAIQVFGMTPGIERYKSDPDQTWWHVTPSWLRLTVHGEADRVEEMRMS